MLVPRLPSLLFLFPLALLIAGTSVAQQAGDADAVLAVAAAALERISDEDLEGFTDLMIEEAVLYSVAMRDGRLSHSARSRADERKMVVNVDIVERAFDPEVHVSGPIAVVWYPYDLYLDGTWSHCGVDIFSLVKTDEGWRIASMTWSVEQPPVCRAHPDGPPE